MIKILAWVAALVMFGGIMTVSIKYQSGPVQIFGFIFLAIAYYFLERARLFSKNDNRVAQNIVVHLLFMLSLIAVASGAWLLIRSLLYGQNSQVFISLVLLALASCVYYIAHRNKVK
jgi:thiol:disulfide interchange protein